MMKARLDTRPVVGATWSSQLLKRDGERGARERELEREGRERERGSWRYCER